MPCFMLAAMPSKDAELHGHKWPALLNHGIHLLKLTIKPKTLLKCLVKSLNSSLSLSVKSLFGGDDQLN